MSNKKVERINVAQIVSTVLVLVIFVFIGISLKGELDTAIQVEEEEIYHGLLQQADTVDKRMAEIFDRAKLSKFWLEEKPLSEIENINLDDYSWDYHSDLEITYLRKTKEHLGSIYIDGKIEELNEYQINEIKRIIASFNFQAFKLDHVTFDSWVIYYTDEQIISAYPYTQAEKVFDPDGLSASEVFEYVRQNVEMLREQATSEILADGWESDLSPDLNGEEVMFTRNWPIVVDDKIYGIYQSGFDLEPLEDLYEMPHSNDLFFIVDGSNQVVYDNTRSILEVEKFELLDTTNLEDFEESPYGKGYYSNNESKLTYILDLENTNWKVIYQVELDASSILMESNIIVNYFVYVLLTLVLSIFLFRYLHLSNIRRLKKEQAIIKDITYDYLTGALSKKMLDSKLLGFIENHKECNFSVAMLDIDDFKRVNDTYGHGFGDKVLKQVSDTIKQSLREGDIVCRFGGEEFLIILSNTDINLAKDICNRIIKNIEVDTKEILGIVVTASIGVVNYAGNHNKESIINMADDNLYKAKSKGKNRVEGSEVIS